MTLRGFRLTSNAILPMDSNASTLDELTAQLSDGFYTTFSTLQGGTRVMSLQAHLDRLYKPAADLHLKPSVDVLSLRHIIADLARSVLPKEARIRLILTKDTGDVYLGIQPLIPPAPEVYRDGVHVVTAQMARHDPRIKGTDFITQSAEQRKLVKGDVYEILMVKNGNILEGMTSNFYAINHVVASRALDLAAKRSRNDILITAQRGILLGVTRRAVLRIARGEGLSIEYRAPRIDEDFDEAFLTSSSRGVVPIVKIDGRQIGQGTPGAWTKRLSLAYQAYIEARSESIV